MKSLTNPQTKSEENGFTASKLARKGYKLQQHLAQLENRLVSSKQIMAKSLVAISTLTFILAILAEVVFSFEVYKDFLSRNVGFIDGTIPALVIAAIIILLAATSSHHISLFFSPPLRRVELLELLNDGFLIEEAKRKLRKRINDNLVIGVILALFTLSTVYLLSQSRIADYQAINPEFVYTWKDLFAPIFFVFLEIASGIHAYHGFSRVRLEVMVRQSKKNLEHLKHECHYQTKLAVEYHEKSTNHHKLPVELREALYRFKHRSIADDNYLDPIDKKELHDHHYHLNSKSLAS